VCAASTASSGWAPRYKLVDGSVKVEGLLVKGQGVQAIKVSTKEKAEPVASK